jgi:hypothetical protein
MSQVLKDKSGRRIGEIKEQSSGKLVIYDRHGSRCGEYDPKTDVTRDRHGSKVGTGNLLATLLPND